MTSYSDQFPAVWPEGLCRVIREIAAEVHREWAVFARCRELLDAGVRLPGIEIAIEDGRVVVRAGDREVAREQFVDDPEDSYFEEGPWVQAVEEIQVALPAAA